jgi:hypothetical protein
MVVEEISAVEKWKKGYEFRHQGRWLEIFSFTRQGDSRYIWMSTYDDIANCMRTFVLEPGCEHRVRYPEPISHDDELAA